MTPTNIKRAIIGTTLALGLLTSCEGCGTATQHADRIDLAGPYVRIAADFACARVGLLPVSDTEGKRLWSAACAHGVDFMAAVLDATAYDLRRKDAADAGSAGVDAADTSDGTDQ